MPADIARKLQKECINWVIKHPQKFPSPTLVSQCHIPSPHAADLYLKKEKTSAKFRSQAWTRRINSR